MGKNNITLSKKHGVNPSMMKCFWCMEECTGIALLGKLKNDEEAPKEIIDWSYKPCSKCEKEMKKGIHLIGVSDTPLVEGQPPIGISDGGEIYPDGSWSVARKEWVKGFLSDTENADMVDSVMERGILCLETDILKQLHEQAEQANNQE